MPNIRKPFFVIPLDLGTVATGSETAGHPATHLGRFKAAGLTWKTSNETNVWARGDFGASRAIDFMAIVLANALAGTKVRLRLGASQADVDGGSAPYDSGAVDFISPAISRDDGLYHSHLELPSVQTYRWWRIDITGHTGAFEAAMLIMGKKLEPSRFYDTGFEFGVEDLGSIEPTRFGVWDEEPGVIYRTIDFTLSWQTEAEIEATFRPMMEKLGKRGIVYCCFDPEPTAYRQARTYLGVLKKSPVARGAKKPRTFAQDYSILSMI